MGSFVKKLFYVYVIALAFYVSYKTLIQRSFGSQTIEFLKPQKSCIDKDDWGYCVFRAANSRRSHYLYVLHGKGKTKEFWESSTGYSALLQKFWQDKQYQAPTVISISFGSTWLVAPQMSRSQTGLLERFKKEVFPTIEKELGRPSRRYLLGTSMGALNAISLGFNMSAHFAKVAAPCAPLYAISPFEDWMSIARFGMQSGAKLKSLFTSISLGRYMFANEKEWLQFSPLETVYKTSFSPSQSFYLSAGTRDEYGLYQGNFQLVESLKKQGVKVIWRPNSGDHCSVDIPSLGMYLGR